MLKDNSENKSATNLLSGKADQLADLKRLIESEGEKLLLNIESIPIAICITNKDGIFTQLNQAFCKLYGYLREELLGRHFTILEPEARRETLSLQYSAFLNNGRESAAEYQITNKAGQHSYVLSNVAFFTNTEQELCKVSCFLDITKIKESELFFKQTSEDLFKSLDRQELTENMLMHDVRKPVANIIGLCNLLMNADYEQAKFENLIMLLSHEAHKSLRLLDAKAGFKRMELETYQVEHTDFDIIRLIRTILGPLEPKIQERKLQVQLILEGEECREKDSLIITADEFFIEIMLNNLIVNALEASPASALMKIELLIKNEKALRTDIHNKGAIPISIRNKFFDKYASYGKSKGLGMGTYTAKSIARAHGGDITFVTSEEEGTTLQIVLPGVIRSRHHTQG